MSEDERALKAARAKAMLKKRQQKKIAGPSSANVPPSPLISPISRGYSPAPTEPTDEKKDLGDLFTAVDSDTSWVRSLPRVGSPAQPGSVSPPTGSPASQTRSPSVAPPLGQPPDDRQILQNHQQTISLLVSEKAVLIAKLERLDGLELKAQEKDALLESEYDKSRELQNRVQQLQAAAAESAEQIQTFQRTEQELSEKCRDQERELQRTRATLIELRADVEQHKSKVRYLEEQISNDERVEKLNSSLKNTQDRADELEYQLSKIKQSYTTLKADRELIESQLQANRDEVNMWKTKHSDLQNQLPALQQELKTTSLERTTLSQEISSLQTLVNSSEKELTRFREMLKQAASELTANTRQLDNARAELKHAKRRADDAEQTQKDLQAEGTRLMYTVDEMRPKIVELTGVKLDLTETVEGLQHALRQRDTTIAQLEAAVDDLRKEKDDADKIWREKLALQETDRSSTHANSMELQAAYTELQASADASRANIMTLEAERTVHHQQAAHQLDEIRRLTTSSHAQWEEISTLRRELDERIGAQEEGQEVLERTQNEIESLRQELSSKDDEIDRLRNAVASSPGFPRSLDDEMLNSLQQQHALNLSALQSKNRELETAIFEAEANAHSLQKRVNTLEVQLAQSSRADLRPSSPTIPPRPSSHKPSNNPTPSPLTRSVIDIGLSPDARHKRQISLSMLKARIDSEKMALSSLSNYPPSRPLSPPVASLPTVRESSLQSTPAHLSHRPRFLDESHVFWCHSCQGDLVVL